MKHTSFITMILAAFMVAILAACGGTNPDDGQGPNPGGNDPGMNQGCEPNCPVEITTVTRGLAYSLPGAPSGEVNINGMPTGTMMILDGSRTIIDTPLNTASRITVEGTSRGGNPIRLVMIDGVVSTMDDMNTDIDLAETGVYRNLEGDWGRLEFPNQATHVWQMRWDMGPDYKCPNTQVRVWAVDPFGQICLHADDTVSHCAGPDQNGNGEPDPTDLEQCDQVIWGRVMEDENHMRGEEVHLRARGIVNGVLSSELYEYRFGRLVPPW